MNNSLISIIIPVYKAESTIHRCVNSILSQTFNDFELILVDDGSPDNSGAICDECALKDSRVHVIHKSNGGASSARNAGLDIMKGEYVTFIDSDDYVLDRYIEHLRSVDADLVIGGFKDMPKPNGNIICCPNAVYDKYSIGDFLSQEINSILFKSPCSKLFNVKIIQKSNLRFDINIHFGEDSVFMLQYLCLCESLATVDFPDYMYYIPSVNKYFISYNSYKYIVRKKVYEYKKLQETKNMVGGTYLATELHDLTSRLFINEFSHKFTFHDYKLFYNIFSSTPEIEHMNPQKGGYLYRTVISSLQNKYYFLAFIILRFIYPLSLLGTKRYI